MRIGTIYMYTSPSGKQYIGQTWGEYHRHWQHGHGRSRTAAFNLAIKKYGFDNMIYQILHSGINTQEELDRLEIKEIAERKTISPNGYNLKSGGSHGNHSVESRKKMSESVKKSHTPELLKIISDNQRRNWENPEYRERIIIALKNIKNKYPDNKRPLSEDNMKKSKKVRCVETGVVYNSIGEAARKTGFCSGNISSRCRKGMEYTYKGFHWEFA